MDVGSSSASAKQIYNFNRLLSTSHDNLSNTNTNNKVKSHSFQIRFFHKPILCVHCFDYIWGSGYVGYGCVNCAQCVHAKCLLFADALVECKETSLNLDSITKCVVYPIENWSIDLVKQWLAVVNLHRYAEVFAKYNITGSKLIHLNSEQLYEFRIRDSYHHQAIIDCCEELLFKSKHYSAETQMLIEQSGQEEHLNKYSFKASRHLFLIHTLSERETCDMCRRPLLGIIHQALLCQECGLMVHRHCSAIGLPECKVNNRSLVMSTKHYIFGVSLFDLCNEENRVPSLLVKAFEYIEKRAASSGEDLYDAYRLTADTNQIKDIKQQLNQNGVDLIQFDRYDLNTIAAIVKSFLRDLQNTVIPEEIYERIVACVKTISSAELEELVRTQLPPEHYNCLSFIMAHLIRVWRYQFQNRGCRYLPDKLFHIFRSILIRPAWENIIQLVYNVDNQTLLIQRLMLECNWGVELPEYKKTKPAQAQQQQISQLQQHNIPNNKLSLSHNFMQFANKIIFPKRNMTQVEKSGMESQEWYWGDIVTRDNTALLLKNCPDGSFIVRNSTDKNASTPYTLCVMKGSFVKSIKIFRELSSSLGDASLYDIEKPCRFESVLALVDYYSRVSLKEYNHNLDLKLTFGVSKFKFGRASEWSIDKLYASYRDALDKLENLTKNAESLEVDILCIREDLNSKRVACEAFDKIIKMYENQLEHSNTILTDLLLKKTNAISATNMLVSQFLPKIETISNEGMHQIEEVMRANKLKLERKLHSLKTSKEQLTNQIEYLNLNVSELQEKLDSMRPELVELRKKRENYHMWLLQRGENEEKIHQTMEPGREASTNADYQSMDVIESSHELDRMQNSTLSASNLQEVSSCKSTTSSGHDEEMISEYSYQKSFDDSPTANSLNWFRPDLSRSEAEEVLKTKTDGAYLIRAGSSQNSKYVLSVNSLEQCLHILIDEFEKKYFLKLNSKNSKKGFLANKLDPDAFRSRSSSQSSSSSIIVDLIAKPIMSSISSIESSISRSNSFVTHMDDTFNASSDSLLFNTLTELVIYYSNNAIKVNSHNSEIKLSHPAFLNEN